MFLKTLFIIILLYRETLNKIFYKILKIFHFKPFKISMTTDNAVLYNKRKCTQSRYSRICKPTFSPLTDNLT